MEQKQKKSIWPGLMLLLFLVGLLVAVIKHQLIVDYILGFDYQPTTRVAQIIDDLELTSEMDRITRASRPLLQTAEQFNQNCQRKESGNYILGCYNGYQIYVYRIKNPEIKSSETVTMAHELLHAVYQRMSSSERRKINNLLSIEYRKIDNEAFRKRIEFYQRTEPGELYNELHSIIGTEFSPISSDLEKYYSRYFNNRQKIVDYNFEYNQKFVKLNQQREKLTKQMDQTKAEFDKLNRQYKLDGQKLTQDINYFNRRAERGSFYSKAEFYRERKALIARQNQLEKTYQLLTQKNKHYNQLVDQYNKTVETTNKLSKDLDSYAPIPDF